MYSHRKIAFERATDVRKKMPLIRTYMHNSREIAFEKVVDVYERQCLWLGLTCITLDESHLKGPLICMKNNASN